jgi:predicted DNA-binding protein
MVDNVAHLILLAMGCMKKSRIAVHFRTDTNLYDIVKDAAAKDGRTVSNFVRLIIESYFDKKSPSK